MKPDFTIEIKFSMADGFPHSIAAFAPFAMVKRVPPKFCS